MLTTFILQHSLNLLNQTLVLKASWRTFQSSSLRVGWLLLHSLSRLSNTASIIMRFGFWEGFITTHDLLPLIVSPIHLAYFCLYRPVSPPWESLLRATLPWRQFLLRSQETLIALLSSTRFFKATHQAEICQVLGK